MSPEFYRELRGNQNQADLAVHHESQQIPACQFLIKFHERRNDKIIVLLILSCSEGICHSTEQVRIEELELASKRLSSPRESAEGDCFFSKLSGTC